MRSLVVSSLISRVNLSRGRENTHQLIRSTDAPARKINLASKGGCNGLLPLFRFGCSCSCSCSSSSPSSCLPRALTLPLNNLRSSPSRVRSDCAAVRAERRVYSPGRYGDRGVYAPLSPFKPESGARSGAESISVGSYPRAPDPEVSFGPGVDILSKCEGKTPPFPSTGEWSSVYRALNSRSAGQLNVVPAASDVARLWPCPCPFGMRPVRDAYGY